MRSDQQDLVNNVLFPHHSGGGICSTSREVMQHPAVQAHVASFTEEEKRKQHPAVRAHLSSLTDDARENAKRDIHAAIDAANARLNDRMREIREQHIKAVEDLVHSYEAAIASTSARDAVISGWSSETAVPAVRALAIACKDAPTPDAIQRGLEIEEQMHDSDRAGTLTPARFAQMFKQASDVVNGHVQFLEGFKKTGTFKGWMTPSWVLLASP